jgi:CRISPR system Cascade subunit CasA
MNLAADKWIPVVRLDGQQDEVSLTAAFTEGDRIADLAVRPPERIALMRLLLCVAHAALDPTGKDPRPRDQDDWKGCRQGLPPRAEIYLRKWQHAFELFGKRKRFLQVHGRGSPGIMSVNKLAFIDADTTTLFDNDVEQRNVRPDTWLARTLLTYQSFAAGGTVGGSANVSGKKVSQKGTNAPCRDRSALHAFLRRNCLIDTIHYNLTTRERIEGMKPLSWGRPVWEQELISLSDGAVTTKIGASYLGRLAPLSRAVWLSDDCATAENANGIAFPNFDAGFRETSCAVKKGRGAQDKDELRLVSAGDKGTIKAVWRELHAITLKQSASGVGGPACLYNIVGTENFVLWVGAFVANRAKVVDGIEAVFSTPAGMLEQSSNQRYEQGALFANKLSAQLGRAIRAYRHAVERAAFDESQRAKVEMNIRKNKSEKQRLWTLERHAVLHFWTAAERNLRKLFQLVTTALPIAGGQYRFLETDWGKCLFAAAVDAYDIACPHETPRQMKAHVLGRAVLLRPDSEPDDENETQEETE